ncbi:erythromycin esterase family protein [Amycolatopsis sp. NBC_00345]|uniref:erythromycin esterase family protein n=1 Tax=Amycolatopsis sp. NBC_00345 TaxID=2975955 RepID=UPI002E264CAF
MTTRQDQEIADWISERAHPLPGTSAAAALPALAPLREIVGDAAIVGIGGSVYGAHEQFTLTLAVVRYLVEDLGFRTLATEEDWDVALPVDEYIGGGEGDLDALIADFGMPWRTREARSTVEWLRTYNATAAERVRFVGVGVIDTRAPVYDLVADHVSRVAPDRVAELAAHFGPIRPAGPDHVRWFFTQAKDKEALVAHARAALELVTALPRTAGDQTHDLAVQHTRQIAGFYEHYTHHVVEDGYRDRFMADNLRWWHEHTGHRIAYWSTTAHSVRSPEVTISIPPKGIITFVPTGHHLSEHFGAAYVSLGLTFTGGEVVSGWGLPPFQRRVVPAPAQPADFAETPLGLVGHPAYLVALTGEAPPVVRSWLDTESRSRVIGSVAAPDIPADQYWLTGGTPRDWFDALIHTDRVTPTADL